MMKLCWNPGSDRVVFCLPRVLVLDGLCLQADQYVLSKVRHNSDHVLHRLLPPTSNISHNYILSDHVDMTCKTLLDRFHVF